MTALLSNASRDEPVRLGRYDVVGFIRRGGMGSVYEAIEREHGRRVALKTLTHLDAESLLRFKTEFRYAADLAHPNLVALDELGCVDDVWFYTMEYVDGVDFIEWVRGGRTADDPSAVQTIAPSAVATSRDLAALQPKPSTESDPEPSAPPSIERLRDALAQLVQAVRAVHAAGLLHLDLKPSNVLVDRDGRVVVLDFGLVRATALARATAPTADPVSGPLVIAGTPDWMAPEQFDGARIGEPADWYGVGLVLYYALTGARAYASMAPMATWYARSHSAPTSPANLVPGLPEDLSRLAVALLDPSPSARPDGATIAATLAIDPTDTGTPSGELGLDGLVGRDAELTTIRGALDLASNGGTVLLRVVGPSGAGKTALVDALRREATRDARSLVLRGRCYERESVPYKAFDGMFDELAAWFVAHPNDLVLKRLPRFVGELACVFPVLARVPSIAERLDVRANATLSSRELRRRAIVAFSELLRALAPQHLLVVAIDDLQWADADSVGFLLEVLAKDCPARTLVVVAYRESDSHASPHLDPYFAFLEGFVARTSIRDVALDVAPLREEDAARLARSALGIAGDDDDRLSRTIARESGGSPYFVLELARMATNQDATRHEALAAAAGVTLENVLAYRVKTLPAVDRALVEVLAIANTPVPLSIALRVAGVESGALRALWSLRRAHLVESSGITVDDTIELSHDRTREAVLGYLDVGDVARLHLSLARELERSSRESPGSAWRFAAARHFIAAESVLRGEERERAAILVHDAGRAARRASAFALAFDCFRAGTRLLGEGGWKSHYALALGLSTGAAESAYLVANWDALAEHVADVGTHARTTLDRVPAWEAEIDGRIARLEYDEAVSSALSALAALDVALPPHPTEADIGAEVTAAMESLARIGERGLVDLPDATEPSDVAAMRLVTRVSSAAYFARPALFPVLACRQVVMSVTCGLSPATPYALAVHAIVLNTLGLYREAHAWGRVALALIERFDDRSLETRTRHVIHDLVCVFTVPLASTLDALREVHAIGRVNGDPEYAAYAAHAYVHNALYACLPLDSVRAAAAEATRFIHAHEQRNALLVHLPFERLCACFAGDTKTRDRLDGDGFGEASALGEAEALGSRSAQFLVRLAMGIARYHYGDAAEASAILEAARPYLDGVSSTWHVPIFHQYAALAIAAQPAPVRAALDAHVDAAIAFLRAAAQHGPANFAHRVALVEAARAHANGDRATARERVDASLAGAAASAFHGDVALAERLSASIADADADPALAVRARDAERAALAAWGAKVP